MVVVASLISRRGGLHRRLFLGKIVAGSGVVSWHLWIDWVGARSTRGRRGGNFFIFDAVRWRGGVRCEDRL
jgi:hypothetical protein